MTTQAQLLQQRQAIESTRLAEETRRELQRKTIQQVARRQAQTIELEARKGLALKQLQRVEKQFKQDRRDWNRKFKYTPVGMKASGVTTPSDAVDLYHDMSSHLAFDSPKLMDRMYPSRGIGRLFNAAVENIGPLGWLNRMIPKRDPIVPENVLAMRDRFSPADILKALIGGNVRVQS